MKVFAIVLLCALAAVQGRYTALQSTRSAAAQGENPWVVHLRIAVSTSGLLNTGVGSLIDNEWILTAAENVVDVRFIWARFGAVNVINPSFVIETSTVRIHPEYNPITGTNNIALIRTNRIIELSDNISPISPVGQLAVVGNARVCGYGENDGAPGEVLNCYNVEAQVNVEDGSISVSSDEVQASNFDNGAPLVSNGAQVGLLVEAKSRKFLPTAEYRDWIEQETGLNLSPEASEQFAPEAVRFIQ